MTAGLVLAGRYRLISKLGQGAMGSVWRAQDLKLGAEVAVKLIDPTLADSPEALKRFRREAQAAALIRSTYVVQILDHGIDNGTPFIAMELLTGATLASRLEVVGKLNAEHTGRILGHVGRALALAHEHGIVHRDLKPENIFLVRDDDGDIGKVLDFGIARSSSGFGDSGALQTQAGTILGTPYYMSPEQTKGQTVDHLTDIWSYGVIVFECLIGKRAFESETLGALFNAICMAPMPVPSQCGPVPPGFDEWFAQTVARDKTARFQTIKEATDKLKAICGQTSNRPIAVVSPAARGDTVLSSGAPARIDAGNAAPPAIATELIAIGGAHSPQTAVVAELETSVAPSSRSIPGLSKAKRRFAGLMALTVLAIVLIGAAITWRTTNRDDTHANAPSFDPSTVAAAPGPSASNSAIGAPAPSANATVNAKRESEQVSIEKADAGRHSDDSESAVSTPQPMPSTRRRTSPGAPATGSKASTAAPQSTNVAGI